IYGAIYNLSDLSLVKNEGNSALTFSLEQNYPNPFNPSTKIKFTLPSPSQGEGPGVRSITLKIYDILGCEITTLINKELAPGNYEVEFNGSTLASGVYFYKLEAGSFLQTKKMILIR
ncbi:MAG: T9SS type A sorting domain-containing protein, partial [Ignavibacteriaceae bacterium]|nr:T9SS type A sorting domain-containing protein [Ignavibacteriaceae bacterium]